MSRSVSHKRRITHFPIADDVVDAIISFLPPKNAVRLAVLSKRFKNSWKSCRDLCFDNSLARNLSKNEYRSIVTRFLEEHSNSEVDRFCLYFDPDGEREQVFYWILKAVHLGISELALDFTPSPRNFLIYSHLFKSGRVQTLKLINCELEMPIPSSDLQNLKYLRVENTRIRLITLESIFSNCLALRALELINCSSIFTLNAMSHSLKGFKRLMVKNCANVRKIRVNAPNLHSLHYYGKICEFNFHSEMSFLEDVILSITPPRAFQSFPHRRDMVITLKYVTILTVSSTFLEGLCARYENYEYREMEFYLMNLKEFQLIVTPESYLNPLDIAIFLRRCPRIQRLFIDLGLNCLGNSLSWDFHGRRDMSHFCALYQYIQYVKIKGFTLKELHVTMARFFLKQGRYLQTLVLVKSKNYNFPEVFTPERLRSEIPANARIEIYEYMGDRSAFNPKHLEHFK